MNIQCYSPGLSITTTVGGIKFLIMSQSLIPLSLLRNIVLLVEIFKTHLSWLYKPAAFYLLKQFLIFYKSITSIALCGIHSDI